MPRYAFVDIYTGFVWGVESAEDAVTACAMMDAAIGARSRHYEQNGPNSGAERSAGASGYIVYAAPDDFDVLDGHDPAEIRRAESLPKHCVILVRESNDD